MELQGGALNVSEARPRKVEGTEADMAAAEADVAGKIETIRILFDTGHFALILSIAIIVVPG